MDIEPAVLNREACSEIIRAFYTIKGFPDFDFLTFRFVDHFGDLHRLAGYWWKCGSPKLIVLVHGYLDSCAYLKPLQRWFLSNGFDVLCLELPGHGESSGMRADIRDMHVYRDVYIAVFPVIFSLNYSSYNFYGHSTANVGMLEYLLDRQPHSFDNIVMATPLVRSWQWGLSSLAWNMGKMLVKKIPRRTLHAQDPEFRELQRLDPGPVKFAPTHWFECLQKWNRELKQDARESAESIKVIFAEKDTVIDTQYNREFIEQRFTNSTIVTVENSDHMLHYEKQEVREIFFEKLGHLVLESNVSA